MATESLSVRGVRSDGMVVCHNQGDGLNQTLPTPVLATMPPLVGNNVNPIPVQGFWLGPERRRKVTSFSAIGSGESPRPRSRASPTARSSPRGPAARSRARPSRSTRTAAAGNQLYAGAHHARRQLRLLDRGERHGLPALDDARAPAGRARDLRHRPGQPGPHHHDARGALHREPQRRHPPHGRRAHGTHGRGRLRLARDDRVRRQRHARLGQDDREHHLLHQRHPARRWAARAPSAPRGSTRSPAATRCARWPRTTPAAWPSRRP